MAILGNTKPLFCAAHLCVGEVRGERLDEAAAIKKTPFLEPGDHHPTRHKMA